MYNAMGHHHHYYHHRLGIISWPSLSVSHDQVHNGIDGSAGQGVEAKAQAKQIARQEPSSRFGLLAGPAICQRIKDMVRRPLGWVQVRLELIDGTVDNIIIIIINVIVHD